MGVCTTEEQHHKNKISNNKIEEESKEYNIESAKKYKENKYSLQYNNQSIEISLNSKKTIVKTIGQIKGESIIIKNNIDCIILIMDYSKSVIIQNCQNCSIFLAPCESFIEIQNCKCLNLISASLNLNISKVKESNFYSFVSDFPIIESSEKITLGNYFVQYMELPEMLIKSKLNIWNNKWSCFKEKGKNIDIGYSTDNIKQKVVDIFMPIFPTCYISIDQFQFIPFTYGKSIKMENNYDNLLIIFRQEDFSEVELLKMLLPEEIENYGVKIISILAVNNKNDIIKNLVKKLENNKENEELINYLLRKNINNNEGIESIQNSQMKNISQYNPSSNSINKSRLNELDLSNNEEFTNNNFKFLNKEDFLFLWFINDNDDFGELINYFNSYFEPLYIGKILKEQFNYDEVEFSQYLEEIFGFDK